MKTDVTLLITITSVSLERRYPGQAPHFRLVRTANRSTTDERTELFQTHFERKTADGLGLTSLAKVNFIIEVIIIDVLVLTWVLKSLFSFHDCYFVSVELEQNIIILLISFVHFNV